MERAPDQPLRSLAWMMLSGLSFAGMSSFVKHLALEIPRFELVFFRSFINFIFVFLLMLARREGFFPSTGRKLLIFRGLAGFGGVTCLFYVVSHLPLSVALLLTWTSPIFVLLFSRVFLNERVGQGAGKWIVLVFVGLFFVARPDPISAESALPLQVILVGLLGAAVAGSAYVAVRAATARVGVNTIVLYFTGVASVLSFPLMIHGYRVPTLNQLIQLFLMGILASLGQLAMTHAYRYSAAGAVSAMSMVNVVFATLLGWVFFGEFLAIGQWIGMGVMIFAISMVALRS